MCVIAPLFLVCGIIMCWMVSQEMRFQRPRLRIQLIYVSGLAPAPSHRYSQSKLRRLSHAFACKTLC